MCHLAAQIPQFSLPLKAESSQSKKVSPHFQRHLPVRAPKSAPLLCHRTRAIAACFPGPFHTAATTVARACTIHLSQVRRGVLWCKPTDLLPTIHRQALCDLMRPCGCSVQHDQLCVAQDFLLLLSVPVAMLPSGRASRNPCPPQTKRHIKKQSDHSSQGHPQILTDQTVMILKEAHICNNLVKLLYNVCTNHTWNIDINS